MNRFQIIEAHPDGENVILQGLNIFPTMSGAFTYYTSSPFLYMIDTRTQKTYNWVQVQTMAIWENLKWHYNGKRIIPLWRDVLISGEYLDRSGTQITNKGWDLWKTIEPYPPQVVNINKIESTTRMMGD